MYCLICDRCQKLIKVGDLERRFRVTLPEKHHDTVFTNYEAVDHGGHLCDQCGKELTQWLKTPTPSA